MVPAYHTSSVDRSAEPLPEVRPYSAISAKGPEGTATSLMLVDTIGVIYEVVPGQTP